MAGYINKVILIGNLGKDPELRHMQDTTKVVSFPSATSENWKDKANLTAAANLLGLRGVYDHCQRQQR